MHYIAHKNDSGGIQTVKEHSESVAGLCRDMAIPDMRELCYLTGLMHDAGKYQLTFQDRINGKNVRIEHSICGAKLCAQLMGNTPPSLLAQLCIAGHHSGIPDCGTRMDSACDSTLYGRLKRETEDFSQCLNELCIPMMDSLGLMRLMEGCNSREELVERFALLVRYCFSCLTDADSLDTAEAMDGRKNRSLGADFPACLELVNKRLSSFVCETELQRARASLQRQAFGRITADAEIYLMNMPTGSGKTLCSIRCALERAIKAGKKRIIYIIPYSSIIEQTADELEKLFGGHAQLLRHQSTFSYEDAPDLDEDSRATAKLACENWDAKLIVTTAVQFFESIYANKRGKLRKLHNMADSVLVFDEAHLMPREFLQPCLRAIAYITRCLNSEAIFLTATMPDFRRLLEQYALKDSIVEDLITDTGDFIKFKKCGFSYAGAMPDDELVRLASTAPSGLIVVNSRRAAREIYNLCGGRKYHLSTYMTPLDRSSVITQIRGELAALAKDFPGLSGVPEERRITVVSTSLIEAGVDLDFAAVFRELSGLDSILQAGGRCNREGRLKNAFITVFERECNSGKSDKDVRRNITKGLLREFADISSPEAVQAYYSRLFFAAADDITSHSISNECKHINQIPFAQYSRDMKLIDTQAVSVAVARDERSRAMLDGLQKTGRANLRELQKYCFTVYPHEFDELLRQGAVSDHGSGIYCLTNPDYYDGKLGVMFEGKDIFS